MLQSINELYEGKMIATNGFIGRVKDFYFDPERWVIRYVVPNTGAWLPGRQILISPWALGHLFPPGQVQRAQVTREQIEGSPVLGDEKWVSRQDEIRFSRHYRWPFYWRGSALWGRVERPIHDAGAAPGPALVETGRLETDEPDEADAVLGRVDAHLLSTRAVTGYVLRAGEETIGYVCDLMVDPENWEIVKLIIRTGHRLSGREVEIAPASVERISRDDSTVYTQLTGVAVERSEAHLV